MAKLLLVEDDANLREIYSASLSAEGYDIVTASNGEEALAVAVKEKPDLILLDVMMPKISGFDVLDIIRSTPEIKDTKVIMMTALGQQSDKDRGTKLGVDRYLVKSQISIEEMVSTVAGLLTEAVSTDDSQDTAALESEANIDQDNLRQVTDDLLAQTSTEESQVTNPNVNSDQVTGTETAPQPQATAEVAPIGTQVVPSAPTQATDPVLVAQQADQEVTNPMVTPPSEPTQAPTVNDPAEATTQSADTVVSAPDPVVAAPPQTTEPLASTTPSVATDPALVEPSEQNPS